FVGDKTVAIVAVDESLMSTFRVSAKFARSCFHDGTDITAPESVRLGVSAESSLDHFDGAVGCADPEIAVAVFGERPDPRIGQFLTAQFHADSPADAVGVWEQLSQPAIGANPEPSIRRFIQR